MCSKQKLTRPKRGATRFNRFYDFQLQNYVCNESIKMMFGAIMLFPSRFMVYV